MEKVHWIIAGTIGPLAVIGILIVIFGWCIVTPCETQIEITSFETPEKISWNEIVEPDFIVMNTGDTLAKNCILRWYNGRSGPSINSDNFSLAPQEIIEIHLQNSEGLQSNTCKTVILSSSGTLKEIFSDAWVKCENSDSGLIRNIIIQECP